MKTDQQLQAEVQAELQWDPSIDAGEVAVAVQGGIVTLTGQVKSYAEKAAVEAVVARVKGVRAIAVELEVRLPSEEERADSDIAQAVDRALAWNSDIPEGAILAKVERGWVTLTGAVDWNYQREAAASAVRSLNGVRGLSNQVTLTERPMPVDLTVRIGAALQRHARQEAHGIDVRVEGSTVVLRGHVDSWADRRAAQEAVWAAPGVTKVVNEILLQP
jgi:osmotically-inducible protein OsmY